MNTETEYRELMDAYAHALATDRHDVADDLAPKVLRAQAKVRAGVRIYNYGEE